MTIEEAIKTALEFEQKVLDAYTEAQSAASEDAAKRFFKVMAGEEKEHVDFLRGKLKQWTRTGKLSKEKLKTSIPSKKEIMEKTAKLRTAVEGRSGELQMELLRKALDVENQTSAFYKSMISMLPEDGKLLFSRFAEIEEGHVAMVQAEINYAANFGVWFDMQEFAL